MTAVAPVVAPNFGAQASTVSPPSRDELMLLDAELRECYRAATYMPDGRLKRGRKVKHDTATRRWIDTVGFPAIAMGKRLPEADLAMLRLSPRSSLSGNNLIARDAWSQLHGRDPRSKKQTVDEQAGQQTLLRWARTNMPDALAPGKVRRGRVASWTFDFGVWTGYTPMQLALAGAEGGGRAARSLPQKDVPPGAYLTWISGLSTGAAAPFRWNFPFHFYLYLSMRALEGQGRIVKGYTAPVMLKLSAAVHRQYEAFADIRLAPPPTVHGDDERPQAAPSPEAPAEEEPVAGALRVPPPPQPVDLVAGVAAASPAQIAFFKSILTDVSNGDRPEYKGWDNLTVTSPPSSPLAPSPSSARCHLPLQRACVFTSQVLPPEALCVPCDDSTSVRLDGLLREAGQILVLRKVGHPDAVLQ